MNHTVREHTRTRKNETINQQVCAKHVAYSGANHLKSAKMKDL
jgi:hypothetical protein